MKPFKKVSIAFAIGLLVNLPPAEAAIPVIDFGAIAQLITQMQTLQQQLATARSQLTQAEQQLTAMTGGRGMEALLSGTPRGYLPGTWGALDQVLQGSSGAYGALAASVQALVNLNAILSPQQVNWLSAPQREQLEAARRSVALFQATTREALTTTSDRFASLQQLIDAIPAAADQKAILDLQARIAAEQTMLQNEGTKLDLLERTTHAEEAARQQRLREQAIADIGSLRTLPSLGL